MFSVKKLFRIDPIIHIHAGLISLHSSWLPIFSVVSDNWFFNLSGIPSFGIIYKCLNSQNMINELRNFFLAPTAHITSNTSTMISKFIKHIFVSMLKKQVILKKMTMTKSMCNYCNIV